MLFKTISSTLTLCLMVATLSAQIDLQPDSSTFFGKVTINNAFENNGLKYPQSDGSGGQVLTTDGMGNLNWSDAGGIDFSLYYGYVCETITTYQIDEASFSFEDCGIVYDSGGESGDYNNNELQQFTITAKNDVVYTRIIVESLKIEDNRDKLTICIIDQGLCSGNIFEYTTDVLTPDTLIFGADKPIKIEFESDGVNTDEGFKISWVSFKPEDETNSILSPIGFFYNTQEQSVGGGVEIDSAWNSVGDRSILFGYGGKASSSETSSIGYRNQAIGNSCNAFGYENEASGFQSSAFGYSNTAASFNSGIIGGSAFGYNNTVSEGNGNAFGDTNFSSGKASNAFGTNNSAIADRSSAFGYNTISDVYQMMAVGCCNEDPSGSSDSWIGSNPVFMVGNGENFTSRSTALTILKNGNTGIGTTTPNRKLDVNGNTDIQGFLRINGNTDGLAWQLGVTGQTILRGYTNIREAALQVDQENTSFTNPNNGIRFTGTGANGTWKTMHSGSYFSFILDNDRKSYIDVDGDYIKTSDKALKKDIQSLTDILSRILELRPVTYQYRTSSIGQTDIGFIAQEVERLFPETVVKGEDGYLGLAYDHFGVLAIQAIKEQQAQLEEKDQQLEAQNQRIIELEARADEVADLKAQNDELEARLERIEALLTQNTTPANSETTVHLQGKDQPRLEQNAPNPFKGETQIPYYLPKATKSAQLRITDANGQLLKILELQDTGEGQVTIKTSDLPGGSYQYTLVLDGKVFATRQMVLTK